MMLSRAWLPFVLLIAALPRPAQAGDNPKREAFAIASTGSTPQPFWLDQNGAAIQAESVPHEYYEFILFAKWLPAIQKLLTVWKDDLDGRMILRAYTRTGVLYRQARPSLLAPRVVFEATEFGDGWLMLSVELEGRPAIYVVNRHDVRGSGRFAFIGPQAGIPARLLIPESGRFLVATADLDRATRILTWDTASHTLETFRTTPSPLSAIFAFDGSSLYVASQAPYEMSYSPLALWSDLSGTPDAWTPTYEFTDPKYRSGFFGALVGFPDGRVAGLMGVPAGFGYAAFYLVARHEEQLQAQQISIGEADGGPVLFSSKASSSIDEQDDVWILWSLGFDHNEIRTYDYESSLLTGSFEVPVEFYRDGVLALVPIPGP